MEKLAARGGGDSPPEPPFETLITLLPVTFTTRPAVWGVGWGQRLVL